METTGVYYYVNIPMILNSNLGNVPSIEVKKLSGKNKGVDVNHETYRHVIPSRELTYPQKMAFWRWFSFSQGGIC